MWDRYINHPFVLAMGNGTLPLESFKGYLMQDYVYLVMRFLCRFPSYPFAYLLEQKHFARANALASYKASVMKDIAAVGLAL